MERTRALRWAGELLQQMQRKDLWPAVPDDLRQQANVILRHYPIDGEIEHLNLRAPDLVGPVDAARVVRALRQL